MRIVNEYGHEFAIVKTKVRDGELKVVIDTAEFVDKAYSDGVTDGFNEGANGA